MAGNNGDVYLLSDKQRLENQLCLNVWFYQLQDIATAPGAQEMADAWVGQILPLLLPVQSANLVHEELTVQNLFQPSDRVVVPMSEPGLYAASDDAATFNAIGIRLLQDNGAVKNGSKRIAGLADLAQENGVITETGIMTDLDDLTDALSDTLLNGILPTFVPAVIKRVLSGGVYSLPTTPEELVIGFIVDALWNSLVTSQVSRKIGVGA